MEHRLLADRAQLAIGPARTAGDQLAVLVNFLADVLDGLAPDVPVEIEAKFGQIAVEGRRIALPVQHACFLAREAVGTFVAGLSEGQGGRVEARLRSLRWPCRREESVDRLGPSEPRGRLRTTVHAGGERVTIRKERVADLALHIPAAAVDVRISINTEQVVAEEPGVVVGERRKDRTSHVQGPWRVDLTRVASSLGKRQESTLELEMELDSGLARREHARLCAEQPSAFVDLVRLYLDNILDLGQTLTGP